MIKKRVWEILELSKENDKPSKYFDYFISSLIALNIVAIVLETEKSFYEEYTTFFFYFELFSIAIFTAEYLLRFWSCVSMEAYRDSVLGSAARRAGRTRGVRRLAHGAWAGLGRAARRQDRRPWPAQPP